MQRCESAENCSYWNRDFSRVKLDETAGLKPLFLMSFSFDFFPAAPYLCERVTLFASQKIYHF